MPLRFNHHRICTIVFLIIISTTFSFAQRGEGENYKPSVSERIFFGGNFGLQLGTYTYIDVSPVIGIWLLPRLALAAGPSYKYLKDPFGATGAYGGKAFSRLVLINDLNNIIPIGFRLSLYTHFEYESLNYRSDFFYTSFENERFFLNNVLGGVGISQYIGRRSSVNISVLWVLNETEIEIYDNPEIRVGVTF